MKIITKRSNGTIRVTTKNIEPSRTDTSFKAQCDVNNIISKWKKTGQINHLNTNQGQYADYSDLPDLQTALTTVIQATKTFEQLPANVRKYFSNDPVEMYNFLQDPQNDSEAIRLGLKTSRIVPNPEETSESASAPKNKKNKKITPEAGGATDPEST